MPKNDVATQSVANEFRAHELESLSYLLTQVDAPAVNPNDGRTLGFVVAIRENSQTLGATWQHLIRKTAIPGTTAPQNLSRSADHRQVI
jgi:hypothetical protein